MANMGWPVPPGGTVDVSKEVRDTGILMGVGIAGSMIFALIGAQELCYLALSLIPTAGGSLDYDFYLMDRQKLLPTL